MKTNYLLPNRFKKVGWALFVPGFIFGIIYLIMNPEPKWLNIKVFAFISDNHFSPTYFFKVIDENVFNEISSLLLIFGAAFIAFSKEKKEDEFISKIRLESLLWATYLNYAVLILATLFIFGTSFLYVLFFNMFTILIFFIIRFKWVLYKSKKSFKNEE